MYLTINLLIEEQRMKGKVYWYLDRNKYRWYKTTVPKSGSTRVARLSNLLSNVGNQSRGAVLAEPFPWTVIQGVTHGFIIINNRL